MNQEEFLVKCNFCNTEIPCPENMRDKKHACIDCFEKLRKNPPKELDKIHIAIPKEKIEKMMPEIVTQQAMQNIFPEF